jgi:hypothetical protein
MDTNEKKKLYLALSAPFPAEAIERTDGRQTGRGYDTTGIKYQYIVNRLNDVLGIGGFRAERTISVRETTTSTGRTAFESGCEIRLALGEWADGRFVPFAEAVADGGHISTNEADARKGAYTNAFKKAAAFFGVGKSAYEGTLDDDNVPGEATVRPHTGDGSSSAPAPRLPGPDDRDERGSAAQTSPSANERNRLTAPQLATIVSMVRRRGLNEGAFRQQVKERYGCTVEYLSRRNASTIITELGGNGASQGNGGNGVGVHHDGFGG